MIPGSRECELVRARMSPRGGRFAYGVSAAAGAAAARRRFGGPEKNFLETHMNTGTARKIDEYVPTSTPMFIANAKCFTRPVPKMCMISVVANTVEDVRIVRTSTSLSEMSM